MTNKTWVVLAVALAAITVAPVAAAQYTDCEGNPTSDEDKDACAKSAGVMERLTTVLRNIGLPLFGGVFLVSLILYGVSSQDERRRTFAVQGMKTTAIAFGAILAWQALFSTWEWIFS